MGIGELLGLISHNTIRGWRSTALGLGLIIGTWTAFAMTDKIPAEMALVSTLVGGYIWIGVGPKQQCKEDKNVQNN